MSTDEKTYKVIVEPQAGTPEAEVAGKTAAAATPAVASIPAAAAPSVEAQRLEDSMAREDRRMDEKEARQDERQERQLEAETNRENRKDDAIVAADIRAKASDADADIRSKDFRKTILTIVAAASVTIITGAITTLGAAWIATRTTTQKFDAMAVEVAEVKSTGAKTLHHVNSNTLANLKTIFRLAQRQYNTTGEEADKQEMDNAQKAIEEHEKADEEIRESMKKAGVK